MPLAVEVGADGIARLSPRLDEGVIERVTFMPMRRRQRSGVAAIGVGWSTKALRPTKVGQHVSISPALRALLLPALEIERMPANVNHAIDRRRAAKNLAAGTGDAPSAKMRLGLAPITPIVGLGVHRDRQRRRHLDEQGAVGSAVFKHEHARAAVLGQPVGEHAARGTRADNNVIESLTIHSRDACSTHRFAPDYAAAPGDAT